MSGLLSGVLPAIYSKGNQLRAGVNRLLDDPRAFLESVGQTVSTDARAARGLLSAAVDEDLASQKAGGGLLNYGPANQRAANALADAYNVGAMTVYPQAAALETARKNAVKMLGLPENNTPMDRAKALGFETAPGKTTYHGARSEVSNVIDPSRSDFGFHTGALDQAEARLRAFASPTELFPEGANVLPLMKSKYANMMRVADEGTFHADALAPQLAKKGLIDKQYAKRVVKEIDESWRARDTYDPIMRRVVGDAGFDGLVYSNAQEGAGKSYAFSNPSVLRSRFAAFDPARVNENDLLGRADPYLLGLLGLGAGGAAYMTRE